MSNDTKNVNIELSGKVFDTDKFFSKMKAIRKIMEEQEVDILDDAGDSK